MKWQGLPESKNVEGRESKNFLEHLYLFAKVAKAAYPYEAYDESEFVEPVSGVDPLKLKEYRKKVER